MSFVEKLRTITTESKDLDQEIIYGVKKGDYSPCNSPSYSIELRNIVNQSREKEKQNEYIANLNAWAVSLGYEAPNKLLY